MEGLPAASHRRRARKDQKLLLRPVRLWSVREERPAVPHVPASAAGSALRQVLAVRLRDVHRVQAATAREAQTQAGRRAEGGREEFVLGVQLGVQNRAQPQRAHPAEAPEGEKLPL